MTGIDMQTKRTIMNATIRNLIGLAAGVALAASAGATTVSLDPSTFGGGTLTFIPNSNPSCGSDAQCGTLPPSHGGQTQGWGYTITNDSNSGLWFVTTGVNAVASYDPATGMSTPYPFSYSTPNNTLFDSPIIAPTGTQTDPSYVVGATSETWTSGTTGLFEITWNTGLNYNTHESGFFLLTGELYSADPNTAGFTGPNDLGTVNIAAPFDASAPEPYSVLLFVTAFGVALWAKSRSKASRVARQQAGRG